VGNTTTLSSGSNATVTSNVSGSNLTLSFGIPAGANGINGVTPSFAIGNVVTGAAGSSASVTATATNSGANVTIDLTIPRGDPGTDGSNGTVITLSDGTPANLGTPSAGNSNISARADHIHQMPQYSSLLNIPANFPTNTTLVSGLSAGYSSIAHGHNYVTSFNNLTGSLTLAPGSSNVTLTANGSTLTIDSKAGLDSNAVIDGGNYVGEIYSGITITLQPVPATASTTLGSWSTQNAPSNVTLSGISHANGAYYALGEGKVSQSTDLSSWSTSNTPTSLPAVEMAYGLGKYVVVGSGTFGPFVTYTPAYSTDGTNWAAASMPSTSQTVSYSSVAFGSNLFVAAIRRIDAWSNSISPIEDGTYVDFVYTSSDGQNWTLRSVPAMGPQSDIAYGNGTFLVALHNTVTFTGVTTTKTHLAYLTSTDGVNWTQRTPPTQLDIESCCFGRGMFLLLPASGNAIFTSTNGISWTQRTLPVSSSWSRVRFCGGVFVATTSTSGTDIATSNDGITWSLGSLPTTASWLSAAGISSGIVAVSSSSMAKAAATTDAASFTAAASIQSGSVTYQWQRSVDAGATWSDISGATSATLSLTGLTTADNGARYRVAASATGSTTVYSQAAILTVT
jgi:hypothetical protein